MLGVLLKAKQLGHLSVVRPHVERIQQDGIYLSASLVGRVLQEAGEAK